MLQLNLPEYNFQIKNIDGKLSIFDNLRKKYVSLTPEEWVRQHFIRYLIEEKGYPVTLFAIEKQLIINSLKKRFDAVIFNNNAQPLMILEFKATTVNITQTTFDQIAVYNYKLNVDYLIISNGINHYCCKINPDKTGYIYLNNIPDYSDL